MIDETLVTLGQVLAPHLDGWAFDPNADSESWRQEIFFSKGGLRFCITRHRSKTDRIDVETWNWPKYTTLERGDERTTTVTPSNLHNPEESSPSISVAIARGAEVIAREIKRRFIPEYERLYTRCVEQAANYQKYSDESRDSWQRVCTLINEDPKRNSHCVHTATEQYHVTLKQNGNKVRVEMDATAGDVEKLLVALGFKPKKP